MRTSATKIFVATFKDFGRLWPGHAQPLPPLLTFPGRQSTVRPAHCHSSADVGRRPAPPRAAIPHDANERSGISSSQRGGSIHLAMWPGHSRVVTVMLKTRTAACRWSAVPVRCRLRPRSRGHGTMGHGCCQRGLSPTLQSGSRHASRRRPQWDHVVRAFERSVSPGARSTRSSVRTLITSWLHQSVRRWHISRRPASGRNMVLAGTPWSCARFRSYNFSRSGAPKTNSDRVAKELEDLRRQVSST